MDIRIILHVQPISRAEPRYGKLNIMKFKNKNLFLPIHSCGQVCKYFLFIFLLKDNDVHAHNKKNH